MRRARSNSAKFAVGAPIMGCEKKKRVHPPLATDRAPVGKFLGVQIQGIASSDRPFIIEAWRERSTWSARLPSCHPSTRP